MLVDHDIVKLLLLSMVKVLLLNLLLPLGSYICLLPKITPYPLLCTKPLKRPSRLLPILQDCNAASANC